MLHRHMGTDTTTDPGTATGSDTDTTSTSSDVTETLGDAGKAALDAERKARREAERRLKAAEAAIEEARTASMSEAERAVEEARRAAREETATAFKSKLAASAVRAAAAGRLQDPEDAIRFLDLSSVHVDDDGEVDTKGLGAMVEGLLKDKPYLAAVPPAGKPGPLPGGGPNTKGGDTEDMNGLIRRMVQERRG